MRSLEISHTLEWYFLTDVAGTVQPTGPILKCLGAWPLKMGPIGCPETSVRRYQSRPRKIPAKKSADLIYTAADV